MCIKILLFDYLSVYLLQTHILGTVKDKFAMSGQYQTS